MSRHRFYASPELISESAIVLDGEESSHLRRVLRLKRGAAVSVFDGLGNEYECVVEDALSKRAVLSIKAKGQPQVESQLRMTLAQALAKGEKFDMIIQKATELGAARLVPLITRFTDKAAIHLRVSTRLERWRRVCVSAAKQSGRTKLMDIVEPMPLSDFLETLSRPSIISSERGGVHPRQIERMWGSSPPKEITILVGPEGGWAEEEIEAARKAGAVEVSLGPRILRTETAGFVLLSVLQYLFGDLS